MPFSPEDAANLRRVIDSCAETHQFIPRKRSHIDVPVPVVEPMPVLDIEATRELTLDEAELTAASWNRALEKW